MRKWFYQLFYRYLPVPWEIGPRAELVSLVDEGRLRPCRAIDLGCGSGANAIWLAEHGFEVTGIDFAPTAIEKARATSEEAGVTVDWLVDDLTGLQKVSGAFDLMIDYGTLDDLSPVQRERYIENVIPLTAPHGHFLLYAYEWQPRWWERPFYGGAALDLGEAYARFSPYYEISEIAREQDLRGFPHGYAVYLMTRRG